MEETRDFIAEMAKTIEAEHEAAKSADVAEFVKGLSSEEREKLREMLLTEDDGNADDNQNDAGNNQSSAGDNQNDTEKEQEVEYGGSTPVIHCIE